MVHTLCDGQQQQAASRHMSTLKTFILSSLLAALLRVYSPLFLEGVCLGNADLVLVTQAFNFCMF